MFLGLDLGHFENLTDFSDLADLVFDFDPDHGSGQLKNGEKILEWPLLGVEGPRLYSENKDAPIWVENIVNSLPVIRFSGNTMLKSESEIVHRKQSYTIFSISRYSGERRGRVISSQDKNWLFGFHSGSANSLFCGEWKNEGELDHGEGWKINSGIFDTHNLEYQFWDSDNLISKGDLVFDDKYSWIGRVTLGGWKKVEFDSLIADLNHYHFCHMYQESYL